MKNKIINDVAAERAILSGIYQYGQEAFIDVADIIEADSFTVESNQIIYRCLEKVLSNGNEVDTPSILSAAQELGVYQVFENKKEIDYLRSIVNFPIHLSNVRTHAVKVRKLHLAREVQKRLKQSYMDIDNITGDETVNHILSLAEKPIFEFSSLLNRGRDDKPTILGENIEEYVEHLEQNPCDMIGLSSGYSRYDTAIGGGFRRKCVDLVAARPKVGKSMFGDNVALHIASNLEVPVLMLDTEMSKDDHLNRILANISGVDINDISTGNFANNSAHRQNIHSAAKTIKEIPYDYISIAGKPFEETLSLMRRWIIQKVGFDENGRVNDCMIIYDYLKMMTSENITANLQEYQLLGFQITSLHNFCVQYDCPCLAFVQLNRDGITKESTDVVSGSDRLIWLCTSFSIFKKKSEEEIADDTVEQGNRKLVPVVCRHGSGLEEGNYINMSMRGEIGRINEGITKDELRYRRRQQNEGFVVVDNVDDTAFKAESN